MSERKDIVLRVERESHLAFLISAFLGAYNRRTDAIAGGLKAIALALSTPQDNSAQVQAHINQVTNQLTQQADAVEAAANHAKEK